MAENNSNIDTDKIVKHWIETSDEDFNTMLTLFSSKSYAWALFLGHISTEKLLSFVCKKASKSRTFYTQFISFNGIIFY